MINTALTSPCSGPNSRFASVHDGARLRHLARPEVPVQVRARRLREHEVVRGVAGAHPPVGPGHLRYVESGSALVGTSQRCNSHHARRKTHRHLLFRVCVVVLSSITSRSVAAAAASSLMRFFTKPELPRRRGETVVGVSVHQSCRLRLTPSLSVFSAESRHCLCFSAEPRHCLYFFLVSAESRPSDELALFLVLRVCVIEFWGHVERMTGENKRDHNAASLSDFGGAMNDWCDRAQSALP